ncbi:MAG: TetR/AcrR family transcriptional regulator [Sciscionella sp.]
MITSAALLLREHGVAGTTVAKVLEHSSGPRGSVGYHFPGGRVELLIEGLEWASSLVTAALGKARARGDSPAEVFAMICGFYQRQLTDSQFAAGCPVGATALEAYDDPTLGPVVSKILNGWIASLADVLIDAGRSPEDAHDLASLFLSSLEGAIMIARVQRSARPIEVVQERLRPLL